MHAQSVQAAFEHQRARHDLIVNEVAGQKPVIGVDVGFTAHEAQTKAPACGVKMRDPVHQPHAVSGQGNRICDRQCSKSATKTRSQVTAAQRIELTFRITLDAHGNQLDPVGRTLAGHRLEIKRCAHHAFAGSKLLLREKPGAAFGHRQQRFAIDGGEETEIEQPGVTLPEEAVDSNVVMNHLAWPRQAAMKTDFRIQQAVRRAPAGLKIDPQIARQEQVGLPGFDCNARGDAPAIEVPRVAVNIMLGHHAALRHRQRLAFDGKDSINQHQRLIRQAHPGRERVGRREPRPEHMPHQPTAEFETSCAIKRVGNTGRPGQWQLRPLQQLWRRHGLHRRSAFSHQRAIAPGRFEHADLRSHRVRQSVGHICRKAQIGLVCLHRGALGIDGRSQHCFIKMVCSCTGHQRCSLHIHSRF